MPLAGCFLHCPLNEEAGTCSFPDLRRNAAHKPLLHADQQHGLAASQQPLLHPAARQHQRHRQGLHLWGRHQPHVHAGKQRQRYHRWACHLSPPCSQLVPLMLRQAVIECLTSCSLDNVCVCDNERGVFMLLTLMFQWPRWIIPLCLPLLINKFM